MMLAFQFQSPGPVFFEIGPIAVRWYGFLIASAVLIGVTLSQYLAKRRHINPDLIADVAIWVIISAIVGARIYYVLFEWQDYVNRPGDIIAIWKGGIAIHGAMIGGALAAAIFARLNKISIWQLTDVLVPSLALGQMIGRWGNFFNSEAFGRPTDLPWKLYIPPSRRPPEYLQYDYFHPTFLYESIWNLLVFCLLMYLFFWGLRHRNRLKVGTLTLIYFIAYSLGRFWIEGLRTDSLMLGSLRIAQVVSIIGVIIGIGGLIWLYRTGRPLPDVVSSKPPINRDAEN
ncbi:prolipoprotein diacylglyceryl transferase [Gloeothece citriformis PCC 7424]|uniref:Phosphatidylglycerol--prolipoprotein diacylglyceryl transferase n=1 Tax=Gloeothece citriformis (strain PCC 7424) TaxID=65393 RepID=B7K712_GLOC7|nr:prolipoprotein diacylglyceryl transferase [Gloeothece citriformis]ACK72711.1 prolipoprotein diacylglyceryl transferase [Gloeothece citriformis PCC 7424]